MKEIRVKDIMVPLEEYATVHEDSSLADAVYALEKAQKAFDVSREKHRAILVYDNNKIDSREIKPMGCNQKP